MMIQDPENWEEVVSTEILRVKNLGNKMTQTIWKLKWANVSSAVISSILSAVLLYVASVTDIATIDFHTILNITVVVGATSLLKAFTTTNDGKWLGVAPTR